MDISSNCKCGKTDSKEKQLIEMKKRLEKLIIEKTVLRMEIRDLENEIISDDDGDDEIAEAVKNFLTS